MRGCPFLCCAEHGAKQLHLLLVQDPAGEEFHDVIVVTEEIVVVGGAVLVVKDPHLGVIAETGLDLAEFALFIPQPPWGISVKELFLTPLV